MITATFSWHWCQMTRWISCTRSQTSLERERNGWSKATRSSKVTPVHLEEMWHCCTKKQHFQIQPNHDHRRSLYSNGARQFCKCGTFQEYHRNYFFILTATVIAFGLFQAYERRVQHILLCRIIHHNYDNAPPEKDVLETSQMCWTDSTVRFFRRRIVRSKATRSSKVTPVHLEEMWHCCYKKKRFQIQPNHDHRRVCNSCAQREFFSILGPSQRVRWDWIRSWKPWKKKKILNQNLKKWKL